jgi:hypothetical protein
MRFIPTRIHAVLDYIIGVALLVFPYVAGAADRGPVEWGTTTLGFGLIVYSLCTNYEFGVVRLIPLKVHLALDAIGGAGLIAVGVIFATTPAARVPLVLIGIIEIGSVLLTQTATSDSAGELTPSIGTSTRRSKVAMPPAAGPQTVDGRPDYPVHATRSEESAEQLRGAIDSGRTGDKIAVVDPAAAPLGSDAEAAQEHDEAGLATARRQSSRTKSNTL